MFGAALLLLISIIEGLFAWLVWQAAKSSIHEILAAVFSLTAVMTFCSAFVVSQIAHSRRKIIKEIRAVSAALLRYQSTHGQTTDNLKRVT